MLAAAVCCVIVFIVYNLVSRYYTQIMMTLLFECLSIFVYF